MLSVRLPRQRPSGIIVFGDILEAYAFTYLASYNTEVMQPRVFTAYQNAYGMDNLVNIPRTVGGRPGATLAFYAGPFAQKVVVGIEGAVSGSQIIAWNRSVTSSTFTNTSGRVFGSWAEYANALMSALTANNAFNSFLTQNNTSIVFTGFSMGGAVAELCAERVKALFPRKVVTCIKFASPRVGNSRYRENLNRNINRASYYCNNDPIHWFPSAVQHNWVSGWDSLGIGTTWLVRDETVIRMDRLGKEVGGYNGDWAPKAIWFAGMLGQLMNAQNAWFDHDKDMYRNMLLNAIEPSSGLFLTRFLNLEHNNENAWSASWRPGEFVLPGYNQLITPAPAAVNPPNMQQAPILNPRNVEPVLVEQDTTGSGVGGDWGEETYVQPVSVMRRFNRRQ